MSDQQEIIDLVAQMESAPPVLEEAPTPPPPPHAPPEGGDTPVEATAAADSTPSTPEADPVLERSWQATIAKEKKLLQLQQELKGQQEALATAPAAPVTQGQPGIDLEKLRNDPLGTLKSHGIHFEDLAKRVLNDGKASPEETMRRQTGKSNSRIEHLEKTIADMQKENTEHRHARMVTEYQTGVTQALADPEFELLRAYPDSEALVFNLASTHANQNGEVLTPADAARRIQGEIREQLTNLSTNEAVRKLLGLQEAPASSQASQTQSTAGHQTPTTLTNALAATPASESPGFEELSEYQQLIEAAKLIPDATG